MTRGLFHLGRWCAQHGWLVLGLWVAVLLGVGLANRALPPPALAPFVLEGTDSASAQVLLNSAFPGTSSEAAPLVVNDDTLDLSTGRGRELVKEVIRAARDTDGVSTVRSPLAHDDLMSKDGHTAIIQVGMAERAAGRAASGEALLANATQAAHAVSPAAVVALGGYLGQQISRTDTRTSEALGLLFAVIVLLVTLRRPWPVLIPFTNAIMAVGIGLTVIKLLGRMVYIPDEAPTLGTMLGLGVGIDYALFLVTRHRNLLRKGFEVTDAVGRTAGTAGAGMVFAGATLLAAVSGLALTGISFLAWLGYSAAVVVALALGAALTLVPALLGLMGARVLPRSQARAYLAGEFAPRPAQPRGRHAAPDPTDSTPAPVHDHDWELDHGFWARIANTVTSRPWPFAIGATTLLLVLAAPMLTMRFQQVDASALPDDTPAHIAEDLVVEAFGPGSTGALAVVAQLYQIAEAPEDYDPAGSSGDPRTHDERLVAITRVLADTPGIEEVGTPIVSTDGGVALWRLTPTTGPSDPATEALVRHLREQVLPQATAGRAMTAYVGGFTPARADLTERVADRLMPFIIGVASLSFLLLLVAYRSLVIPLKAAAMNLLSISAAYGVVVMVFQWGWGAHLIGLDGPVPIESYVPMMMFAILFGLSMDYEVFLLTGFQEHWERTRDMRVAVRRGLADTGQVITSAALIMVAVFSVFVIPDNAVIKMFGVGLATAVLVDATIVRCVLVPSLMVLAASITWWLPRWLDRALPHLHVEGDPAALDSIEAGRTPTPADDRPGAGWLAVVVGVLVGWWVGGQLMADSGATAMAGLPVAVATGAGALLAWLPRSMPRGGALPASRYLGLLLGCLLSAVTYLGVGALSTVTDRHPALQAGAGVLIPLGIVAATALRRFAIPLAVGILAMASALVVIGPTPASVGQPLLIATVPSLVALVTTRVLAATSRRLRVASRAPRAGGPADADPTPAERPDPVGAGR